MELNCSFQKLVGGLCASDKRYEKAVVVPVSSCYRDISGHTRSVEISDVSTEVDLILARASVFSLPRDIATWTICPAHHSSLGIGWRRGANRCHVLPGLSKHAIKGKSRKADRGIGKVESKAILQHTGSLFRSALVSILLLVFATVTRPLHVGTIHFDSTVRVSSMDEPRLVT